MASTGAAAGFFGITAPSAYAETLADSLGLNKLASNWSAALGTTTVPGSGEAPGKPAGEAGGEGDGAGDAAQTEAQKQLKQLTCVRAARATRRAAARAAPCSRRGAATRWDARSGRAGWAHCAAGAARASAPRARRTARVVMRRAGNCLLLRRNGR